MDHEAPGQASHFHHGEPRIARRGFLRACTALTAAQLLTATSWGQSGYPSRPVRMLIPFAAGGATDVVGRVLAQRLTSEWGQSVFVENRGGAGGVIGTAAAAQSAPDGHTVLFTSLAPITIAPQLPGVRTTYEVPRDLVPVSLVARQPVLLVVNSRLGVKSLPELLELARRRPGKLSYGTPGNGTELHLIGEHFKLAAKVDIIHVPYKGGGPAINDLVGGTIDMMVVVSSSILPHLRSGAVRALATTDVKRVPALPDVPTLAELGYGEVDSTASWGAFMPAGSPAAAIARWHQAVASLAADQGFLARMAELGVACHPVAGAEFTALLQREKAVWNKVITHARIRGDQ